MYTVQQIAQIIGAEPLQLPDPEALVEHLLFDSRSVPPPHGLFFAFTGPRHDGHRYLADAYEAGVRHFVVSRRDLPLDEWPDANFLGVNNTLDALQQLAARHRDRFTYPVVGITGSNGKTVVKEWLYQLLRPDFEVVRSPKSYNSQIGVPLTVWQMQEQHTLALVKASISQPGEMERLARVVRPTVGIFTNIGSAHREGFASKADKIREKMRLFEHCEVLIYCADHEAIAAALPPGVRTVSWSKEGRPADVEVRSEKREVRTETEVRGEKREVRTETEVRGEKREVRTGFEGTHFSLLTSHLSPLNKVSPLTSHFSLLFSDAASLENAIHCVVAGLVLGVSAEQLAERLPLLEPVEMRLELKAGIRGCTLVNDFYNLDLASLRIALQFAAQQGRGRRLTLVLSDLLQSGQPDERLYTQVAEAVLSQGFVRVIGIGQSVGALRKALPEGFELLLYRDTDHFLSEIARLEFRDEVVLLKGARPFAFERIARRLEQKAHKTVLEINLSALIHNLNVYTRLLRPGVRTLVMVKAAAYGSGAAEVARLLEFNQVDYLGVAYADEGIELREAGVRLPILVLNPEPASLDAMFRFDLEPEVYSLDGLADLLAFAGTDKQVNIHLKLDTGMHRLGFEEGDIPVLIKQLQQHPNVRVQTLFSHLSASDAPQHDAFTHQQAAAFGRMTTQIAAGLGYQPIRHLCNTGGIARFPEYHFDMVRLGIGLYGIDPTNLQERLRVVNTLRATVSQVKEVPAGDTVGYNRNSGPLASVRRIATISIGYADGFLRAAGGGRYSVLIHNQLVPTIGNVCMDMTMIDVTHLPDVRAGDEVVVFGKNPPVQRLAECFQTIPYEVFTTISERVKRVYVQE